MWLFFARLASRGEAVGAEAQINSGIGEALTWKRGVFKIIVAPRAMDNVGLVFGEQSRVAPREVVDVNGENVFAEQFVARKMGHR